MARARTAPKPDAAYLALLAAGVCSNAFKGPSRSRDPGLHGRRAVFPNLTSYDEFIVKGYTAAQFPDYQMSSWLMAVLWRGMSGQEIAEWVMNNRALLHLKYVIWGQRIWNPSQDAVMPWASWRSMDDRHSITENHW